MNDFSNIGWISENFGSNSCDIDKSLALNLKWKSIVSIEEKINKCGAFFWNSELEREIIRTNQSSKVSSDSQDHYS